VRGEYSAEHSIVVAPIAIYTTHTCGRLCIELILPFLSDRMENIQLVCNASRLPFVATNRMMKNYVNVILTLPCLSVYRNVLRFCGQCTRFAYRTIIVDHDEGKIEIFGFI